MFKTLLTFIGAYTLIGWVYKAGKVVGEAKCAVWQIRKEADELKEELEKNRD